ncbi:MAG: hypothetical protein K1Y01_18615 [Vicinamibacteria bacterium]|nr:hypothetical protein [Vicinamibacteria bacterium]
MEKRNCKLAAVVASTLALSGGLSNAEERPTFTVVLHVTDFADVDDGDFGRARTEAQRIFDDAAIRLVFVDIANGPRARACEGLNLFVSFLSPYLIQQRTRQGMGKSVLGSASPSTGHAFIYSERVRDLALRRRIDKGVLLGRVIAHELGHLLMGGHDHSRTGLMTVGMETDPSGLQALFSSREARALRARLESTRMSPQERSECGTASVARDR